MVSTVTGERDGLESLRTAGIDIGFVTNSSTKTREECRDRLAALDIEAAVEEILTSASVTATYVQTEYPTRR